MRFGEVCRWAESGCMLIEWWECLMVAVRFIAVREELISVVEELGDEVGVIEG